jgi:hypothetical protein
LGKPILPIMVADGVGVLPPRLLKIQYVDYRKRDIDAHAALVNALKGAPPAAALPQPPPEPPAIPMSYLESIAGQIDGDAPLSIKDQSDIVSQLRSGLDDPESTAGAHELLIRFSKKPYLYARTAREIEALLAAAPNPNLAPPPVPDGKSYQGRTEVTPVETRPPNPPGSDPKPAARSSRVGPGIAGAIIMTVLAAIAFAAENVRSDEYYVAIAPAIAGALAGTITGRSARVITFALLAGIAAAILSIPLVSPNEKMILSVMMVYAVSPGVVVGAILGATIKKARGWP